MLEIGQRVWGLGFRVSGPIYTARFTRLRGSEFHPEQSFCNKAAFSCTGEAAEVLVRDFTIGSLDTKKPLALNPEFKVAGADMSPELRLLRCEALRNRKPQD